MTGGKRLIRKTIRTAIFLLLFAVLFTFCGCKEKNEYVFKIDGEGITQKQFAFFCSLVLEDEAFAYTAYYNTSENFTESVKKEAFAFAKEYICRYHEAKKAGFKISDEEITDILNEANENFENYKAEYNPDIKEEDYYDYIYGITKKEYLEFKEKWTVIDLYNDYQYETADVSEEAQRKAYEDYETFLNARTTAIIVLNTEGKNQTEMENALSFAKLLVNKAKNGEDFYDLMKKYSDDEDITENGGTVDITASFKSLYPNLYGWSRTANPGDISVVEEESAIYVVKCEKIVTFDDLKDTTTMIEWTQFAETQRAIEESLNMPKYEAQINRKLYESVDISNLVSSSIEYWTALWSAYGFPATK